MPQLPEQSEDDDGVGALDPALPDDEDDEDDDDEISSPLRNNPFGAQMETVPSPSLTHLLSEAASGSKPNTTL